MSKYFKLICTPQYRCRYRALPHDLKEKYHVGASLYKKLMNEKQSGKVKLLKYYLMTFAKNILAAKKDVKLINEELDFIKRSMGQLT